MDAATFRQGLDAEGFTEVLERVMPPDTVLATHQHPFDARLMVLAGDMVIEQTGEPRRMGVGDWCEVPRQQPHAEHYGAQGTTLLIGRRHPPA